MFSRFASWLRCRFSKAAKRSGAWQRGPSGGHNGAGRRVNKSEKAMQARTSMQAQFFDQEITTEDFKTGEKTSKVVPFFRLERSSMADKSAAPFIFEGPATESHKKQYKKLWEEYLASKGA